MEFVKHDGGRAAAGWKGNAGDCVCRSIAIVTGKPYQEVYDEINRIAQTERKAKKSSARNGVRRPTIRRYMESLGYTWTPTMGIGTGCKVHLKASELPTGRLVVSVTCHITAVIDGVLYDTHDCSRNETRCVYGYFRKEA